jgi:hypothetical protein
VRSEDRGVELRVWKPCAGDADSDVTPVRSALDLDLGSGLASTSSTSSTPSTASTASMASTESSSVPAEGKKGRDVCRVDGEVGREGVGRSEVRQMGVPLSTHGSHSAHENVPWRWKPDGPSTGTPRRPVSESALRGE